MDAKKAAKNTIDNVRDATNETLHRSTADAEKTRREVAGDQMTAGEKAKSVANEAKNRVQAEVSKTKRDVRNDG